MKTWFLGFDPAVKAAMDAEAETTKAEYWVDPLKVRFAISQLEQVLPDEVNSPRTLQVIAQRCDDIAAKLPTRENPGMEDTAFALKKAAGEFRIASRLLNEPPKFSQSYTRAKQYVHAALIKVSGIPGAHRSLDEATKADDTEVASKLGAIQQRIARIRRKLVDPVDAARALRQDSDYLKVASQLVSNQSAAREMKSVVGLMTNAAGFIETSGEITTQALNALSWVQAGVNLAHGYLRGKPDWQSG